MVVDVLVVDESVEAKDTVVVVARVVVGSSVSDAEPHAAATSVIATIAISGFRNMTLLLSLEEPS
jgi:hypothetical protein